MIVSGTKEDIHKLEGKLIKKFRIKETVCKDGEVKIISWEAELMGEYDE